MILVHFDLHFDICATQNQSCMNPWHIIKHGRWLQSKQICFQPHTAKQTTTTFALEYSFMWKGHGLERDFWQNAKCTNVLQNWLASGGAYVLKQRDQVSFWQHFHNTSLWSGSRAWHAHTNTHTHTFKVDMCVSNTNYTANMLANKFRRTTFATSFDYHRNLSAWLALQSFPSNTNVYDNQWSDKRWLAAAGAANFTRPTQWLETLLRQFLPQKFALSWLQFTCLPSYKL